MISYTATSVVATVEPSPAVTGVSPSAGPTAGGNTVTITGSNFTSGATVTFGTAAASSVSFVSSTELMATAPANSAGPVDVTVTTSDGTSETSPADQYTYDAPPTVTRVSRNQGSTKGGNTIAITGTNFTSGATVNFGTTAAGSVTFVSSTSLTVVAPTHSAGTVDVTVATPGGTTPTSSKDNYTYYNPATISSVVPNTGPTAGGNTVTINGTNFLSGKTTVKFGTVMVPSTQVTFVSTNQVTTVAPEGPAGSVNVAVSTPAGTSAATAASLYGYGAPTVSSFIPSSGITGRTVTITGTSFVAGVTVTFGALSSPKVAVTSRTKLTAVVPNGDVASTISVADAQGTGTSAAEFTPTLSITRQPRERDGGNSGGDRRGGVQQRLDREVQRRRCDGGDP